MVYVKEIRGIVFAFIFGLCLGTNVLCATSGNPVVRVDGFDQIAIVWHETDTATGFLKIMATYGTGSTSSLNLTNPTLFHAFGPVLATSKAGLLTPVNAVAAWKAYDLNTGAQVIQVGVCSAGSWTINSGITVSDPVNEIPQNEYDVTISGDCTIIGIIWTSYMIATGDVQIRHVYSVNAGTTWHGPFTLL
jgi:hypothetical protein